MFYPVFTPIFSPLNTSLTNKSGKSGPLTFAQRAPDLEGPCAVYVGENFAIKTQEWYNMPVLVNDISLAGVVVTKYFSSKELKKMQLTVGGYRLLTVPNAGGSSVISEVLSFEVLNRCFSAKLKKTEMEVSYFPLGGSITDYTCELFHNTVAVSVTRAMKFQGDYCLDDAQRLLNKKLRGIIQSTRNSLEKWSKQILHVWSISQQVTRTLLQAYDTIEPETKANTIVMITTAENADYIFSNG